MDTPLNMKQKGLLVSMWWPETWPFSPPGVQELFPSDQWLRKAQVEGYLAIPLNDPQGRPLWHLG
jgi:hypothetical protein